MSKRMLLVGDGDRTLGLAEGTLAIDDRYEIVTVSDGEEAIAAPKAHKPD
jgi:hypothetical protein